MSNETNFLADQEKLSNSLIEDWGNAANSTAEYAASKLALAAAEAKVATSSIIMMLVLALFALILLCSVWTLICLALAQWILTVTTLTLVSTLLIIAALNFVALVVSGLLIKSLASAVSFGKLMNS